jgi:hypothetical protein
MDKKPLLDRLEALSVHVENASFIFCVSCVVLFAVFVVIESIGAI